MLFNINSRVKVKLTDYGKEVLRNHHDALYKIIGQKAPEYTPRKEDAEGWSEWQLWALMQELGPSVGLGKLPFEATIEIIEHQ